MVGVRQLGVRLLHLQDFIGFQVQSTPKVDGPFVDKQTVPCGRQWGSLLRHLVGPRWGRTRTFKPLKIVFYVEGTSHINFD